MVFNAVFLGGTGAITEGITKNVTIPTYQWGVIARETGCCYDRLAEGFLAYTD